MRDLFDNPLANMLGPQFLVLFWVCALPLIAFVRWQAFRLRSTDGLPPLPLPSKVDPYQAAYLRGGDNEVIRTVVVDLFDRKLLMFEKPTSTKKNSASGKLIAIEPTSDQAKEIDARHKSVLEHSQLPAAPQSVFTSRMATRFEDYNASLAKWADQECLIVSAESKSQLGLIQAATVLAILGLGFYKLASAIMHGRYNVGFLIASLLVATILLFLVGRVSRLTQRGQQYLNDMQTAHAGLRFAVRNPDDANETGGAYGASLPIAAMGLFGISALDIAAFQDLRHHYQKSATTHGCGTGSSCGAASACGSGSGGDGGGGGGGCGGGGCGGCGGS